MEILVYGLLFGFWYLIKYGIIYPIKYLFYGISLFFSWLVELFKKNRDKTKMEKLKPQIQYWEDKKALIDSLPYAELLKLNTEIKNALDYKVVEEKEHLWFHMSTAEMEGNKYLFIAKKQSQELDFDSFADGIAYIKEIRNTYKKIYCFVPEKDTDLYTQLMIKCLMVLNIAFQNEKNLKNEIDIIIKRINPPIKKERVNTYKKTYKNNHKQSGYEKLFPHVMTDDDDSDFDKAIDDMIFMDLMDDDF